MIGHLSGTLGLGRDERLMKPIDHSRPIPDLDRSSEFGSVKAQYLGNGLHAYVRAKFSPELIRSYNENELMGEWVPKFT